MKGRHPGRFAHGRGAQPTRDRVWPVRRVEFDARRVHQEHRRPTPAPDRDEIAEAPELETAPAAETVTTLLAAEAARDSAEVAMAEDETSRPEPSESEASEPARYARFDVLYKDQHITEFSLEPGRSIVGRTGDNDLQIRSRFISRHHMEITTDRDRCLLEDLNSTNGTFIDSERVMHHVLQDGDVIQLGEHKLIYRELRNGTASRDTNAETRRIERPKDEDCDPVFESMEFEGNVTEVYESNKS